jgi:hypothetical protein
MGRILAFDRVVIGGFSDPLANIPGNRWNKTLV